MNSIDELWDEPLAPISPPKQLFDIVDDDDDAPQPSKRPLFLESDSDNDNPTTQTPDDIANLFEDLDVPDHERIEGITPSMDLDALRRAANARHAVNPNPTPYEVVPSSPTRGGEGGGNQDDDDDGAIKKRKTIPRLDEGLLLSDIGIPALVKDAKKFKAKGKGHEVSRSPPPRITAEFILKYRRPISIDSSLYTNTGCTSCIRETSLVTPYRG